MPAILKKRQTWLLKTEPSTYSFKNLLKDKQTNWNGVRNYQARNNLKKMTIGDLALIYHSGDEKAVVGISKVISEPYPDPDAQGGDWVQVDLIVFKAFEKPVTLSEIKATQSLKELALIKQSRLSVMPVVEAHAEILLKMGKTDEN